MSEPWVAVAEGLAPAAAADAVRRLAAQDIEARADGGRVLVPAAAEADAEAVLTEASAPLTRAEATEARARCTESVTDTPLTGIYADEMQRSLAMHGIEAFVDSGGLAGLVELDAFPECRVRVAPDDLPRARALVGSGSGRPQRERATGRSEPAMSDAWTTIAEGLTPDLAQQAVKRLRAQDIEARGEAGRILVPPDLAADAEAVLADAAAAEAEAAAAPPHTHGEPGSAGPGAGARVISGEPGFDFPGTGEASAAAPATSGGANAADADGPSAAGLLTMLVVLSGLALLVMKSCA